MQSSSCNQNVHRNVPGSKPRMFPIIFQIVLCSISRSIKAFYLSIGQAAANLNVPMLKCLFLK